jgi:hypothetical protein
MTTILKLTRHEVLMSACFVGGEPELLWRVIRNQCPDVVTYHGKWMCDFDKDNARLCAIPCPRVTIAYEITGLVNPTDDGGKIK